MNLIEFLNTACIEDLGLPDQIIQKLRDQNITGFQKIYASIQTYRVFGECSIEGLTDAEMQILSQKCTDLMVTNGLIKPKISPARGVNGSVSSSSMEGKPSGAKETAQQAKHSARSTNPPASPPSPLAAWENRLAPQLRKVELVGEISITKDELNDISAHFSRLFYNHSTDKVLDFIARNYPATFLVFMVGQGIFGYNNGDFWSEYERVLRRSIDSIAFGRLFEKLIHRFGRPQFRDLRERSRRYVDPILAHGGIPIYCLKDFFSNIVLNCVIRPQLFALEGEELVEEVLKYPSYTANTDKPVINFLEYGGPTAANLLDRARKLLLAWQQNQTILSAEEAGLPLHITQYFAEWTRENAFITLERGSRNKLKRPQLSLDPWGLGIFLCLPSQPVSARNVNDLCWKVDTGQTHEEIKARTQRKGDQVETREITLRLNHISDLIHVGFSHEGSDYEWNITGYSDEHLILAFDSATGHSLNHILARETWLLFPDHLSISVLDGEGCLQEVLPELPGEWSKFKLECWDLSQANRLGLMQHDQMVREIYLRNQEKIELPSLEGGNTVSTDIEENPKPLYVGKPPAIRIPLPHTEDIQSELGRWQIKLESMGVADPEISQQVSLEEVREPDCVIADNTAIIQLSTARLLTNKPAGTYQVTIKGPLGRDAVFSFHILPEFRISGLKELYIPDRNDGPEAITFSIQTSLLAGVDSMNGEDGIRVVSERSGMHQVLVPPGISLVSLLVRRETVQHQFIQIPVYLRIKRLRWRIIGDSGRVENWLYKYENLPLLGLLQEETPLLIVDLPSNSDGKLTLYLNLVDIQGNVIQQLKPADRSTKWIARFWRYDLSKIKHSLEMNDSPIFRLDLVGVNVATDKDEFILPVFVLNRKIQLMQLQTEVYSSPDQHHILVMWEEKKQLRSRALILWSLFRPWQPPIIENIPDSTCGEYEFLISRKDHAEGIYRMQMVVVDPWAPSLPPTLPPDINQVSCHDIELSSPTERLKKLEREIGAATYRQTTQFSNRIEISLIRQYLGEIEASNHDLLVCCRNLIPATTRELLTLRSILNQVDSKILNQEFGEQIIRSEILSRLYSDMATGEITLSDFMSILMLAPESQKWPVQSCEILVQLEDPKIRFSALTQLVAQNITKAVFWVLGLLEQSRLSLNDAVELLYEEKYAVVEQLRKSNGDPITSQLVDLLGKYNPYSGLPVVHVGSWVLTNAGWGRIEEILDPHTRISVDSFLEGDGQYILSVTLHMYESYDLTGEKALINMATSEITFPRANRIFICQSCHEFVTTKVEIFKNHLLAIHGNVLPNPGEHRNVVHLVNIQFNMNPQEDKRE